MLKDKGLFTLSGIVDPISTTLWGQGWLRAEQLELEGEHAKEWNNNLYALRRAYIRITDQDYELKWDANPHGSYSPKQGYLQLFSNELNGEIKRW